MLKESFSVWEKEEQYAFRGFLGFIGIDDTLIYR